MRQGRPRLAAAAALAAVAALAGAWVGARAGPHEDRLAALVPAGALVYLHAGTDDGRGEDVALARLLQRLPTVRRARDGLLGQIRARSARFSFARDVRPWLGDEVAFAVLRAPSDGRGTEVLALAHVRDRDVARVFVSRAGGRIGARYRGVDLARAGRVTAAVTGDVLIAGQDRWVRAAIDRAEDGGASLAEDPRYLAAAVERPEGRALELYATDAGLREVLATRAGPLRGLLAAWPRTRALLVAAAAQGDRIRLRLRATGAGAATFAPRAFRTAPRDAAGVLAIPGADRLIGRLFVAAPWLEAAARAAGVDVERDLLAPLHGGEAVLWARAGAGAPEAALVAHTRDPARTLETLGRLQAPLAAALAPVDPEVGQVPQFEQRQVGGVDAFVLPLAGGVTIAYAVAGDRVVLATAESAVARIRRPARLPAEASVVQNGIEIPGNGVEAILLSVPGQLLALGDQLGVTADSALQAVRDDLLRVRAISAVARREETDTTAELLFHIP